MIRHRGTHEYDDPFRSSRRVRIAALRYVYDAALALTVLVAVGAACVAASPPPAGYAGTAGVTAVPGAFAARGDAVDAWTAELRTLRENRSDRADRARRLTPPAPRVTDRAVRPRIVAPKVEAPVPAAPSGRVETAISYALAQVGDPYRWAAEGPDAFDCSGLVKAAFARIGVALPHQSGEMLGYGTRVSRSQLRRGDVVWPQSGHVAIYLGNDRMVHASSSRGAVAVSDVYGFWTARRML